MSLFKFGFSSSENREFSNLWSRKRPSDALTEEKTKDRKKKCDQETRKWSFQESWEKNREWLIYNEEKSTMHCQWCMDYAADSDKKSLTNKFILSRASRNLGGQVDFFIYLSPGQLKIIWEFLVLFSVIGCFPFFSSSSSSLWFVVSDVCDNVVNTQAHVINIPAGICTSDLWTV